MYYSLGVGHPASSTTKAPRPEARKVEVGLGTPGCNASPLESRVTRGLPVTYYLIRVCPECPGPTGAGFGVRHLPALWVGTLRMNSRTVTAGAGVAGEVSPSPTPNVAASPSESW